MPVNGSPMLLHLIPNDRKFFPLIVGLFEKANPGGNCYVVMGQLANGDEVDYRRLAPNCVFLDSDVAFVRWYDSERYTGVIAHSLFGLIAVVIAALGKTVPVAWYFWGGEVYNTLPEYRSQLFQRRTRALYRSSLGWREFFKTPIRPLYHTICRRKTFITSLRQALRRVDCCVTFPEDFDKIRDKLNNRTASLFGTYYSLREILPDKEGLLDTPQGENILVGNSAHPTNNHIEVLERLAKLDLGTRKVLVPLSYGIPRYRDKVIKRGERVLGNVFVPLVEFLPYEEYNRSLRSCAVAIMNHHRQQAMGNIVSLVWMGCRLYLNSCNSVYHYLRRVGVDVSDIGDELRFDNPDALSSLGAEDVQRHRAVIEREFGDENVFEAARAVVACLQSRVRWPTAVV